MNTSDHHNDSCSMCLDYVAGLLDEDGRFAFERHAAGCEACRRELGELQAVWGALPLMADRIEPPSDLKEQILTAARRERELTRGGNRRFFGHGRTVAAALALVLAAGTLWNVWLYRHRDAGPPPLDQALSVKAAQIERLVALKPVAAEGNGAYGVACVVDNGKSRQFVVYVFGAKRTEGRSAYQVWLNKDGEKRSAGTFRVDNARGVGLLAMPLRAGDELRFDEIGITLEPDDRGRKPRGAKAFGMA